jgi:prepilin-type N-terminal cleavage/methylation domain-containing protein
MRAPHLPLQSLRPSRLCEKSFLCLPLHPLRSPRRREKPAFHGRSGFTLAEMLVAISVLALLAAFMGQLLNSSSALVAFNDKHMDADAQARGTLDRIAVDLGEIVKRADASYYLKDGITTLQTGNDQLAFFSQVPGYLSSAPAPVPSAPSPVSLVAYRVNSTTMGMERMGKGLIWNGAIGANSPIVFLPQTIASVWPQATNMNTDPNYEAIAPGIFRFEYYYLLKGQILPNGTSEPAILSATPWDTRMGHTSVSGLSDVAAVGVAVAVVDPASRNLVSNAQLTTLAGQMNDFSATISGNPAVPGQMETQWTTAITASSLPHAVSSSIRVYGRLLYLSPSIQ